MLNMTSEQAIQILTQATGMLQLSREDHNKILMALNVLTPKEEPKEEKSPKK